MLRKEFDMKELSAFEKKLEMKINRDQVNIIGYLMYVMV